MAAYSTGQVYTAKEAHPSASAHVPTLVGSGLRTVAQYSTEAHVYRLVRSGPCPPAEATLYLPPEECRHRGRAAVTC